MSGYTIIDVDTHVTETPDVWTSRVPATMKDRVPRIDLDAKGRQWWFLGDRRIANPGLTATAGVGDMTTCPPAWGGFGNQEFLRMDDEDLKRTCVQVSNDWQTEWASAASAGDERQCGRVRQARTARIDRQKRTLPVAFRSSVDSPPRLRQRGRPWWESACLQSSNAQRSSGRLSPPTIVGAFVFSGLVGIFFGYSPAHTASRHEWRRGDAGKGGMEK